MRRVDRVQLTAEELAQVPVGVQPEMDGLLACLECGAWFRQLMTHLVRKHDLDSAEYRRAHQLPAALRLRAGDLLADQAVRARAQYPSNTRLQAGMSAQARAESLRLARQSASDSRERAGTRLANRQRLARRSEEVRSATRAAYDERARRLGHRDIAELLAVTDELRDADLGLLLGVAESTAGRIRLLYGARQVVGQERRAQQTQRGTRRKYDRKAQEAGYADIAALFAALKDAPERVIMEVLGVSKTSAGRLRRDSAPDGPRFRQLKRVVCGRRPATRFITAIPAIDAR